MKSIGFMGAGAMGSRMAMRLLRAGHAVTVYNRTESATEALVAAGARATKSPREAASDQDVVISMVRDDEASRTVWTDRETGALAAMKEGAIAIESSTLTPSWAEQLARRASERGIALLDAPVVGSRPQAETGTLIYLVGGDEGAMAEVGSVLRAMGGAAHYVGQSGRGALIKLMVNTLFATQIASLAELLVLSRGAGIDDGAVAEVLSSLPVMSPALKGAASQIAAANFDPLFPIDLVEKDLVYTLAVGPGNALPTTDSVRKVYANARERGLGSKNISAIAQAM